MSTDTDTPTICHQCQTPIDGETERTAAGEPACADCLEDPGNSSGDTDRAPIVYLPDGSPVRVRLIEATCEGDVSGEGHYGYYPRHLHGEDPTVYFEGVPSVECVHCGDEVAQALIEDHHVNEHPMERWNPAFYPEVFEDAERTQDTDTGQ